MNNNQLQKKIVSIDSVFKDGYEYFSTVIGNGLYRRKLYTDKIEFITTFDEKNNIINETHSKIISILDKIICIPLQSKYITIYDIKTSEKISIRVPDCNVCECTYFVNAFTQGTDIFMIPGRYDKVLKLNVKDLKFEEFYRIEDDENYKWNRENPFFYDAASINEDCLYLAPYMDSRVIKIDLKNKNEVECFEIPYKNGGTTYIFSDDKGMYFVGTEGEICFKPTEENVFEMHEIEKLNSYRHLFRGAKYSKGKIYLLGATSGKLYVVNTDDFSVEKKKLIDLKNKKVIDNVWYDFLYLNIDENNRLETVSTWDGKKYLVNMNDTNEVEIKDLYSLDEEEKLKELKILTQENYLEEGIHDINLESFLNYLVRS